MALYHLVGGRGIKTTHQKAERHETEMGQVAQMHDSYMTTMMRGRIGLDESLEFEPRSSSDM